MPVGTEADTQPLLPLSPDVYTDEGYLFPLLANLAADYPEAAARTAVGGLKRLNRSDTSEKG